MLLIIENISSSILHTIKRAFEPNRMQGFSLAKSFNCSEIANFIQSAAEHTIYRDIGNYRMDSFQ